MKYLLTVKYNNEWYEILAYKFMWNYYDEKTNDVINNECIYNVTQIN